MVTEGRFLSFFFFISKKLGAFLGSKPVIVPLSGYAAAHGAQQAGPCETVRDPTVKNSFLRHAEEPRRRRPAAAGPPGRVYVRDSDERWRMRPAYLRGGHAPHRTERVSEDTDGHGNAARGTESPQEQQRECVLPGRHSDF